MLYVNTKLITFSSNCWYSALRSFSHSSIERVSRLLSGLLTGNVVATDEIADEVTVESDIIDWVVGSVSSRSCKLICSSFVTVSPEEIFLCQRKER